MTRAMQKSIIQEKLAGYIKANRKQKTFIITSVCEVNGMNRKSVIRAFAKERKRSKHEPPPKVGRPKVYTAETDAALAWVWKQYEYPSAERLYPEVSEAVRIFRRDNMWNYSQEATEQLLSMSLGAMKVRTVPLAKKAGLIRGASTTKAGELIKSIPIYHGDWKDKPAGHGQLDTVVHSGQKLMGTMAYTVNYVDVSTYWQEPVAQLNKSEQATLCSMKTIKQRLPFVWLGGHPDNGSEFINWNAKAWFESQKIELTRSRPNKSNDNCYIEQRNLVVIRKYVGYERYDCQKAVDAMNDLYEVLRLYINFFQPTFKLVGKEKRVKNIDGKQFAKPYKRVYDEVRTPYQRVLDSDDIPQEAKDKLTEQYETLNPKVLRDRIKVLTIKLERVQRDLGYHY